MYILIPNVFNNNGFNILDGMKRFYSFFRCYLPLSGFEKNESTLRSDLFFFKAKVTQ